MIDAIHSLTYAFANTNGGKKSRPPEPIPRPSTGIEAARHRLRQRAHESLTARLLGKRRQK